MVNKKIKRKGALLAGGIGPRLYPATLGASKCLLPVYDKPMVYYPLSVLMNAGIREVLIVARPDELASYRRLLGDGSHLGVEVFYAVQIYPNGIAGVFDIAASFIGDDPVCLILGDNIFYGADFCSRLNSAQNNNGATIFSYPVDDPERFGVVLIDSAGAVLKLEEKPFHPVSNLAVTGVYFFNSRVVDIAKKVEPSERGEKEIIDVLTAYQKRNSLSVEVLSEKIYGWMLGLLEVC